MKTTTKFLVLMMFLMTSSLMFSKTPVSILNRIDTTFISTYPVNASNKILTTERKPVVSTTIYTLINKPDTSVTYLVNHLKSSQYAYMCGSYTINIYPGNNYNYGSLDYITAGGKLFSGPNYLTSPVYSGISNIALLVGSDSLYSANYSNTSLYTDAVKKYSTAYPDNAAKRTIILNSTILGTTNFKVMNWQYDKINQSINYVYVTYNTITDTEYNMFVGSFNIRTRKNTILLSNIKVYTESLADLNFKLNGNIIYAYNQTTYNINTMYSILDGSIVTNKVPFENKASKNYDICTGFGLVYTSTNTYYDNNNYVNFKSNLLPSRIHYVTPNLGYIGTTIPKYDIIDGIYSRPRGMRISIPGKEINVFEGYLFDSYYTVNSYYFGLYQNTPRTIYPKNVDGFTNFRWSTGDTCKNLTLKASDLFQFKYSNKMTLELMAFDTIRGIVAHGSMIIYNYPTYDPSTNTTAQPDDITYSDFGKKICGSTKTISISLPYSNYTLTISQGSSELDVIPGSTTINYTLDKSRLIPPYTANFRITSNNGWYVDTLITVFKDYTKIVIDGNTSVCSGSNLMLRATGASTFLWNNSVTYALNVVKPTINTTYSVVGTDINGCVSSASINIDILSLPTVTLPNSISINVSETKSISVSPINATSVLWSNGSTTNTINIVGSSLGVGSHPLNVIATSASGCINVANTTLNVYKPTIVTVIKTDTIKVVRDTTVHLLHIINVTRDTTIVNLNTINVTKDTTIVTLNPINVTKDTTIIVLNPINVTKDTTIVTLNRINVIKDSIINVTRDTIVVTLNPINVTKDTTIINLNRINVVKDTTIVTVNRINVTKDTTVFTTNRINVIKDSTIVTINRINVTKDTTIVKLNPINVIKDTTIITINRINITKDTTIHTLNRINVTKDTIIYSLRVINRTKDTTIVTLNKINITRDTTIVKLNYIYVIKDTTIVNKPITDNPTSTTGQKSASVNMYPNPCADNLTIDVDGMYDIELANANGIILLRSKYYNKTTIDMSTFHPGTYFISVLKDGTKNTSKIIKQ